MADGGEIIAYNNRKFLLCFLNCLQCGYVVFKMKTLMYNFFLYKRFGHFSC
jgi:hypothetical protein